MNNGFYDRTEIKLVMYENQGDSDEMFVVVSTDKHCGDPVVLSNSTARVLMNYVIGYLSEFMEGS